MVFNDISKVYNNLPWFNELTNKNFCLQVGKGEHILFWQDICIGSAPWKDVFPRLYSISMQQHHTTMGWNGMAMTSYILRRRFF